MRAVVQRVLCSSIKVDNNIVSSIGFGLVAFIGFHRDDSPSDMEYIANKILQLRVFNDEKNVMNKSLLEVEGELLIISQFTLYGDVRKGRRPSYSSSMPPEKASKLYNEFIELCKQKYLRVKSGIFRADMEIDLKNSGPVTILLDSNKLF
jgi:D-tyrosyl-tRNA(Tyr) deacylase